MNYFLTQRQLGNSIENCVIGNFIPGTLCLVTSNANVICLYTLPTMSLLRKKFVFEQVLSISKYKMSETHDGLLIYLRRAKVVLAQFNRNEFVVSELKYFENEDIDNTGFIRCTDKVGILHVSRSKFAVFSLDNSFQAKVYSYIDIRPDVKNVLDIKFLSKYSMATVCILYRPEIKRYTSDMPSKALIVSMNPSTHEFHIIDEFTVDKQHFKICPVKNEIAFIGHNEILFRNSSSTYAFPLNKYCLNRDAGENRVLDQHGNPVEVVLDDVRCFSMENHLWIVNRNGMWLKCVLHLDIKRIVKVDVEVLPLRIAASSICLYGDLLFVGSVIDDSILFRMHKNVVSESGGINDMKSGLPSKEYTTLSSHNPRESISRGTGIEPSEALKEDDSLLVDKSARDNVTRNDRMIDESIAKNNTTKEDIEVDLTEEKTRNLDGYWLLRNNISEEKMMDNTMLATECNPEGKPMGNANELATSKNSSALPNKPLLAQKVLIKRGREDNLDWDIETEIFKIRITPERQKENRQPTVSQPHGPEMTQLNRSKIDDPTISQPIGPKMLQPHSSEIAQPILSQPHGSEIVQPILLQITGSRNISPDTRDKADTVHELGPSDIPQKTDLEPPTSKDSQKAPPTEPITRIEVEYERLFSRNAVKSYSIAMEAITAFHNVGPPAFLCHDDGLAYKGLLYASKRSDPTICRVCDLELEQIYGQKIRGYKCIFAVLVPLGDTKGVDKNDQKSVVDTSSHGSIDTNDQKGIDIKDKKSIDISSRKDTNSPNKQNTSSRDLYILLSNEKESKLFSMKNGMQESPGDYLKTGPTLLFDVLDDCIVQVTAREVLLLDYNFRVLKEKRISIRWCKVYGGRLYVLTAERNLMACDKGLRMRVYLRDVQALDIYDGHIVYGSGGYIVISELENESVVYRGSFVDAGVYIASDLVMEGCSHKAAEEGCCKSGGGCKVDSSEENGCKSLEESNGVNKPEPESTGTTQSKATKRHKSREPQKPRPTKDKVESTVRLLEVSHFRGHFFLRTSDNRLSVYKLHGGCMYKCFLEYPVTFSLTQRAFHVLPDFIYVEAKTSYFVFCSARGVFMHRSRYALKALSCINYGEWSTENTNKFMGETNKSTGDMYTGDTPQCSLNTPQHKRDSSAIEMPSVIFGVSRKGCGFFTLPESEYYSNFVTKTYPVHRTPRFIQKVEDHYVVVTSEEVKFDDSEFSATSLRFHIDLCVFWKNVSEGERQMNERQVNGQSRSNLVNDEQHISGKEAIDARHSQANLGNAEFVDRNVYASQRSPERRMSKKEDELSKNSTATNKSTVITNKNTAGVVSTPRMDDRLCCVSSYALKPNEMVTDIKYLHLSNEAEIKPYVVVCAGVIEGEDKLTPGALYLFEVISVVPDIKCPYKNMKLRIFARETTKGPITQCQALKSSIVISVGTKIMIYSITSSRGLIPIAFHELDMLTTSVVCIKNYICATDIYNGPKFFFYQSKPTKLHLLASSTFQRYTNTVEYLVHESSLSVVSSTKEGEINVHTYSPNNVLSSGGTKLVKRLHFRSNLGQLISAGGSVGFIGDKHNIHNISGNHYISDKHNVSGGITSTHPGSYGYGPSTNNSTPLHYQSTLPGFRFHPRGTSSLASESKVALVSESNFLLHLRQIPDTLYQTAVLYQSTIMEMLQNTLGIHFSNYGEAETSLKALSVKMPILSVVFREFEFLWTQEKEEICKRVGIGRSKLFMLISSLFD